MSRLNVRGSKNVPRIGGDSDHRDHNGARQERMNAIPLNDLRRHNMALQDRLNSAACDALSSGWYIRGQQVENFEREFADYCGVPHCIGTGNGTDAIEIALRALDIQPGAKVVTVANAGMYAAAAIRCVDAEPLFVDVDPLGLLMDVNALMPALESSPSAVIVTHLYGRFADMQPISELCARFKIPVVEDCAQAHGAMRGNVKAGTSGSLGCFSFYPTKNLGALGDGGAIVSSDSALAQRARQLQQYGWTEKYVSSLPGGRNSRLDEVQASMLRIKLPFLDSWNHKRRAIAKRYIEGIAHPRLSLPSIPGIDDVVHLFVVRTDLRDSLRDHLLKAGIASEIHYPVPDHHQPCYAGHFEKIALPVTDHACAEIVTLPCFPEMVDEEIERVINACNHWHP
jgi:dTDP-4-amino-4,6-dideoxygalactose transaminase